jgi:hypothetical protein
VWCLLLVSQVLTINEKQQNTRCLCLRRRSTCFGLAIRRPCRFVAWLLASILKLHTFSCIHQSLLAPFTASLHGRSSPQPLVSPLPVWSGCAADPSGCPTSVLAPGLRGRRCYVLLNGAGKFGPLDAQNHLCAARCCTLRCCLVSGRNGIMVLAPSWSPVPWSSTHSTPFLRRQCMITVVYWLFWTFLTCTGSIKGLTAKSCGGLHREHARLHEAAIQVPSPPCACAEPVQPDCRFWIRCVQQEHLPQLSFFVTCT